MGRNMALLRRRAERKAARRRAREESRVAAVEAQPWPFLRDVDGAPISETAAYLYVYGAAIEAVVYLTTTTLYIATSEPRPLVLTIPIRHIQRLICDDTGLLALESPDSQGNKASSVLDLCPRPLSARLVAHLRSRWIDATGGEPEGSAGWEQWRSEPFPLRHWKAVGETNDPERRVAEWRTQYEAEYPGFGVLADRADFTPLSPNEIMGLDHGPGVIVAVPDGYVFVTDLLAKHEYPWDTIRAYHVDRDSGTITLKLARFGLVITITARAPDAWTALLDRQNIPASATDDPFDPPLDRQDE